MNENYSRSVIEQKTKEILIEKLFVAEEILKPEAKLEDDLGADSLDAIELTMSIEREFDICIPEDRIKALRNSTLSDIYTMIEQYINSK